MSKKGFFMRIKSFFLYSLLMLATTSKAEESVGSITLEGRGVARSAPELVSLRIAVTSICYNSSQEASQANAEISNQVLEILKKFKQTEADQVTATGGANVLQTESNQVGLEPKIICERKWHAENHLRIEMTNMPALPDLQDQVFAVLKDSGGIDPNLAAQTYAEFGRPEFHLRPESAKKMRDTAQMSAFDDAKAQLAALETRCSFQNLRLVRVNPSEYSYIYKLAGERAPAYSTSTPIIPDELEVQAVLRMEWQFDPATGCRFQ
jgi:uncharacterized protein YggE